MKVTIFLFFFDFLFLFNKILLLFIKKLFYFLSFYKIKWVITIRKNMAKYELMLILNPGVSDDDRTSLITRVKEILESNS